MDFIARGPHYLSKRKTPSLLPGKAFCLCSDYILFRFGSEQLFVGNQHLARRTDARAYVNHLHLFAILILQSGRYALRSDDVNFYRCFCLKRLVMHVHTHDINLVLIGQVDELRQATQVDQTYRKGKIVVGFG